MNTTRRGDVVKVQFRILSLNKAKWVTVATFPDTKFASPFIFANLMKEYLKSHQHIESRVLFNNKEIET